MESQSYNIIFEGEAADGVDTETAKGNLQNLFKADRATVDRLFSVKRTVLKKDVSADVAKKYQAALANAGVRFSIEPELVEDLSLEPMAPPPAEEPVPAEKSGAEGSARPVNPYAPPTQNAAVVKQVFCRSCGARIDATATACPQCGTRQQVGKPKSKVVAALLAFFLGFIGAHRFYLGQWVGIFYIFLGLFGWAIAWIEAIVFLVTSREKWDQKYGNVVGSGAGLIIGLLLGSVVVIGILAAIAIPAYNDYTQRSRVAQAIDAAQPAFDKVEEFARREKFLPDSNAEAGVPKGLSSEALASVVVSENGVITMSFKPISNALENKTLLWIPTLQGDKVTWDCSGGSLQKQYRSPRCRDGDYSGQQIASNRQEVFADDGTSRVEVPASWRHYPEMNDIASIEYLNGQREEYFIVISEPKADFTANMDVYSYNDLLMENYRAALENLQIKYLGEMRINNMPGLKHELRGELDNTRLVYLMVALEGKTHYHQLAFWTRATRWERSKEVFEEVLATFVECPDGCGN